MYKKCPSFFYRTYGFGQIKYSDDSLHSMVPDGGDLGDGALGEATLQGARQPVNPVHGLQRSVCGLLLSCACNTRNSRSRTAVVKSLQNALPRDFRLTCATTSSNFGNLAIVIMRLKSQKVISAENAPSARWFKW